jgi:TIR domain
MSDKNYEIALSYASEDRAYVEEVAEYLSKFNVKVFFDGFEESYLWGKNLTEILPKIYMNEASYTVLFVSKHYAKKIFPNLEKKSALNRALIEKKEYILPARFDDTNIDGLLPDIVWQDLRQKNPYELSLLICKKLDVKTDLIKDSDKLPLSSNSLFGETRFNYSSYDGKHILGTGEHQFKTKWSPASDKSIYSYNWDLKGISLAKPFKSKGDLLNLHGLDFTSSSILIREGEFCILKNHQDLLCLIEIMDIQNSRYGDAIDELTFRYWITERPIFSSSSETDFKDLKFFSSNH